MIAYVLILNHPKSSMYYQFHPGLNSHYSHLPIFPIFTLESDSSSGPAFRLHPTTWSLWRRSPSPLRISGGESSEIPWLPWQWTYGEITIGDKSRCGHEPLRLESDFSIFLNSWGIYCPTSTGMAGQFDEFWGLNHPPPMQGREHCDRDVVWG